MNYKNCKPIKQCGMLIVKTIMDHNWNEINGLQGMELLKKRRLNEISEGRDIELLKTGNLKEEGKIKGGEGDRFGNFLKIWIKRGLCCRGIKVLWKF